MVLEWLSGRVRCKDAGPRRGRRPRRPGRLRPRPLALEPLEGRNLPSLFAPVVYDTGPHPGPLAVGDLRGNGRFDIVTANAYGARGKRSRRAG